MNLLQLVSASFGITTAKTEEGKKEAAAQIHEALGLLEVAFEQCSNGKPFFGGDRVGYIDIALGSFLSWLRMVETLNKVKLLDKETTPKLSKWAEVFAADKDVMKEMAETEKLIEYVHVLFAKLNLKAGA